jgi:hypothetical protein
MTIGNKETYTKHFVANIILFSRYGLSSVGEYMEHGPCISTYSLDRNRVSEHAMDGEKTPDKYYKHFCPIWRIKCVGILIRLWNE